MVGEAHTPVAGASCDQWKFTAGLGSNVIQEYEVASLSADNSPRAAQAPWAAWFLLARSAAALVALTVFSPGRYAQSWLALVAGAAFLFGLVLWKWQRGVRWVALFVLLVPAGINVAAISQLHLAASSVAASIVLTDVLACISLAGLLWCAPPSTAWRAAVALGVGALVLQLTFIGTQGAARREFRERVERMHTRLAAMLESGKAERPASVPKGAADFDQSWRAAKGDPRTLTQLMSNEINLRLAPCTAVQAPLANWRSQSTQTPGGLLDLVAAGLTKCDDAGIDLDALEYVMATPYFDPNADKP